MGSDRQGVTALRWIAATGEVLPAGEDVLPSLTAVGSGYLGVEQGPDAEGVALWLWTEDGVEPAVTPLRTDDGPLTATLGAPTVAPCFTR